MEKNLNVTNQFPHSLGILLNRGSIDITIFRPESTQWFPWMMDSVDDSSNKSGCFMF